MSDELRPDDLTKTEDVDRVQNQLLDARLNLFDMWHTESRSLYKFLHPHEKIIGAIRGHLPEGGSAMLVATNLRIMYLDKMPFSMKVEEVSYQTVGGITYEVGRFFSHITLQTAVEPIHLRWVATRAAEVFIRGVEAMCIDQKLGNAVTTGASPPYASRYAAGKP